jgi:spermidine/putrescine transport system permease protein
MFNVSYVVVTVKARLEGMDQHIEEAAMDLGANELTTFRRVTLPLIAPGVAAAALLAAALSVDDYVITSFNAGQTQTFPLFIYGATRQGVPAEVNVLASGLLFVVLALLALNLLAQRARGRREARALSAILPPLAGAPAKA